MLDTTRLGEPDPVRIIAGSKPIGFGYRIIGAYQAWVDRIRHNNWLDGKVA